MTPQQERQLLQEIRSVRKELREIKEMIEPTPEPDEYLNLRQACNLINVSNTKFYQMLRNQQIPCAKKFGGQWRFKKSALLKCINQY